MKATIQQLFDELQEELNEYAEMGIVPISKLSGSLRSMRDTLAKLKAHVIKHPFKDQEEEIEFFKKDKPRFVAEQLYVIDLCIIQTTRPRYDATLIREYLESELRQINIYFQRYSFLYQYYQLESTDMDMLFFLRGAYPKEVLLPETADLDPQFSTACDHAWARFIAYERLREWLLDELKGLDGGTGAQPHSGERGGELQIGPETAPGVLKWTGESINLVELAYGIWLTGQVNHGDVSVTEIVEFLERVFRVRIGKAHRRWQSLARRKRMAAFRFVDDVKAALEKRLEEEMGK